MHLEIPKVSFAGCAMDCIGPLPATCKGNRHVLTFIFLPTSYWIMVPLKGNMADEVSMTYIKEILLKTLCSKFILQDNGTEFKNDQLMTVINTLGIKYIYSSPYYPQGNGRIENVHNFLKHTIAKFIYGSQLEWMTHFPWLPTAITSCHQWMTLESPYYLIQGQDPLEGRLSNQQKYCRYMGDQPGRLAVQELQRLWKLHAKLLAENRIAEPATNKKITRPSGLKIGQLVLVINHHKGPFNPAYIYDHWVAEILRDSMALLTTPDGKEKKCNIHDVELVSSLEVYIGSQVEVPTGTFPQFWDSINQNLNSANTSNPLHSYNLWSKMGKW